MRILSGPKTTVRLPALPRRVTVMAIATLLLVTVGFMMPYYLTDLTKRTAARSDEEACTIYVSDNGPGLPNANAGMLLMPHMGGFGRPDGTGLGLKIVVDLLSWHGAKIEMARSDSHGTHFKITVPHESRNAPRDDELGDDKLGEARMLDAVPSEG